jgi:hypothetical protein
VLSVVSFWRVSLFIRASDTSSTFKKKAYLLAIVRSLGENGIAILSTEVKRVSLSVRYEADVNGQPGNVGLGNIVALLSSLDLLSGDKDGVIASSGAVLQLNGLVLELLLVLEVIKGTIGSTSHDNLF